MVIMMRAGGGVFLCMVMSMVNIVMAIMTVMAMATVVIFCDDGYSYKIAATLITITMRAVVKMYNKAYQCFVYDEFHPILSRYRPHTTRALRPMQ